MKKKKKKTQQSGSPEAVAAFVKHLTGWLRGNADRVRLAYESHSGWEVWLHVELFLYIRAQAPQVDITRETGGYTGDLRPDFFFEGVTVEIKTEGEKQTGEAFAKAVYRDMGKVESQSGHALVVGVCCTDAARNELGILTTSELPAFTVNGKTVYVGWVASEAVD